LACESLVVRVATFNALHGARRGLLVSNRLLVASCRTLDADVLALQEGDRHSVRSWFRDQPALVARSLGMRVATAPVKRTPVGGWQCNALATRGNLTDVETVELPLRGGNERRVVLLARVLLPGTALTVACTHLQNGDKPAALMQLDAALDALEARPGPHVLAGDLNLGPDDVEPVLRARQFAAAPSPPTSPAQNPRRRIDWIACDGDLTAGTTRVHELFVSDHRAVVTDVVVSQPSK
jgi:endonuclease/exonuclease/phosphatase family metal-dependent hydrolase